MAVETLSFASIWSWFRLGCDSWFIVGASLGLVLALSRVAAARRYSSGFVVPISLLLFRKAALYIPVSGTLSTEDEVIFWSTGACVYFAMLLIVHAAVAYAIWWDQQWVLDGGILEGLPVYGFLLLIGSAFSLPLDGWNHLVMPFLAHLGIVKLLLINPLLLPLASLALIVHLAFTAYRQSESAREINKLLLAAVVVCGFVQFCLQPWQLAPVRAAVQIEESSLWNSMSDSPSAKLNQPRETETFLSDWMGHLDDIRRCRVNLVELPKQDVYQDCKLERLVTELPRPWTTWTGDVEGWQVIIIGALMLGLLGAAGRRRNPRETAIERTAPQDDGTYVQVLGDARNLVPAMATEGLLIRRLPLQWLLPAAVLAVVLVGLVIVAGIHLRSSWMVAIGLGGLSLLWLLAEFIALIDAWLLKTADASARALGIRDRKGRRDMTRSMSKALARVENIEAVLNSQPDQFLLALAASDNVGAYSGIAVSCLQPDAAAKSKGKDSLVDHPACTALTRVGFVVNSQNGVGSAGYLPPDLWPSAIDRLARSQYGHARVIATTYHALPRDTLMNLYCEDPETEVRQAAWQVLRESLREEDAIRLVKSKYAEVRAAALESNLLPQHEGQTLSHSGFTDVRLWAVRFGALPNRRLRQLRGRDPDPEVRYQSFERTREQVTRRSALAMVRSSYGDVRKRAIQSGFLSDADLEKLYVEDLDESVRQAAWDRFHRVMPLGKAEAILKSCQFNLRAGAIKSNELSRQRLLEICVGDWQDAVRTAAWERLQSQLSPDEAESLSRSLYGGVRSYAVQSGLLPRGRLVEMCSRDTDPSVRRDAWKTVQDQLSQTEAESISKALDPEMRLGAVNSGLLSPDHLHEMSQDLIISVREAARRRLQDVGFDSVGSAGQER